MLKREPYRNRIELLQGTLDLLILQTLQWGPQHGYSISQAIRANSGDVLQVDTGSLYPALHRLERQRWIASKWEVSENRQRTKTYRLTPAGKKQLLSEHSRWRRLVEAMDVARTICAGSALRLSLHATQSRVHADRGVVARSRNRRKHGDFHSDRRLAATIAAGSRPAAPG